MNHLIMGMLAETSLHPGAGQASGVVDLPVAREVTTGYPVIVGSSLKGALRDKARQEMPDSESVIFGEQEKHAGSVAITDARLLLLPVRSLTMHFRWVTCPYLLERYLRDRSLARQPRDWRPIEVKKGHAWVTQGMEDMLFLEELSFQPQVIDPEVLEELVSMIAPLIAHESLRARLGQQLVILSDEEFTYFARYGLSVQARNVLDKETKESKNLWYEETLPPDTLFYTLFLTRAGGREGMDRLREMMVTNPYLQVGGNETMGQGWCMTSIVD